MTDIRAAMTTSPWLDVPLDRDLDGRVETVARKLRATAVARDRAGSAPHEEARLLKQAGLTGLTLEPFLAGPSGVAERAARQDRWKVALSIVRRLARADLSAAALLGYNFMSLLRLELAGDTPVFRAAVHATAHGKAIWGGTNNPKGPAARLRRVAGGYRLDGRKTFATGSQSADFIVIGEAIEDTDGHRRLAFVLPADTPGLSHGDDWTAFGARRTASGSILFDGVFVPDENVFRSIDAAAQAQAIEPSSGSLSFQILFVNMLVGAAQGAIELALDYLARRGDGRYGPGETYIPEAIGLSVAQVNAAAALADRATEAFSRLMADSYANALAPLTKGVLGDTILQAKIVADRVGLDVATRVLEATGARSATQQEGLDRIWRDIRVYTLHDPVALRARDVGTFWTRASRAGVEDELAAFHTL